MRAIKYIFLLFIVLKIVVASATDPMAGFCLPDSISEMKIKFRLKGGLIILPVVINDSIRVNLLLDTGCRNLVLFGKKFISLLNVDTRTTRFSGHGQGKPVEGRLSFNNKVAINAILGTQVPVVVVGEKNVFARYSDVHGVIGYELFLKFEIEINSRTKEMIFRPAAFAPLRQGFNTIPLEIVDSKPVMNSTITFDGKQKHYSTIIDTGSYLALFVNGYDPDLKFSSKPTVIGRGMNGIITGYKTTPEKIEIGELTFNDIDANVIDNHTRDHYASIGMEVIRDYIMILNYSKAYVSFKKNTG
jgi:hypothetical protein